MEPELTRKQLLEKLEAANTQIAAMSAPDPATQLQLKAALKELDSLRRPAPPTILGDRPKPVPYRGKVQATEDCHFGGVYHKGPFEGAPGEVFDVDVACLWSDDPYRPVNVRHSDETDQLIVEPNPQAVRIDFRFRPKGTADVDIQPLRASSF